MLLSIAVTALGQFVLYYWRAVVAGVAAQPLSANLLVAAGLADSRVSSSDFWTLSGINRVTPALQRQSSGLSFVRAYFHLVDSLRRSVGALLPSVGQWSQQEMATCACYAAVVIDRKMQSNLAWAAAMRSC
ncbi:MAG TPA: hypothetical protein VOA41_03700 [Candidatus Dormibacteraeota bacterium]|nr:hypothetical protein [Candidatus Dormibacteraeota bacterium]